MINLGNYFLTDFLEVAEIERAQSKKDYAKDSILLQISATKGQLHYLEEPQSVDSKFAVITPKGIYGKYLYYIMQETLPQFLQTYQTGLNIKIEIFEFYKINIHKDIETQFYISKMLDEWDNSIEKQQNLIAELKNFKKYHLDVMFTNEKGDR